MCTLDLTDHDMYAPTFETMVLVPMHTFQYNMINNAETPHNACLYRVYESAWIS